MSIFVSIALFSGVLFIVLFWAWFTLWKELFVDEYRQELFVLRDELFNLAVEKRIPFDSDEYKGLRELVNGTIRFAHVMSPATFLGILVFRNKLFPDSVDQFADPRLKLALENYPDVSSYVLSESAMATIDHLYRSSLSIKAIFQFLIFTQWTKESLAKKMESWMDEIGVAGTVGRTV